MVFSSRVRVQLCINAHPVISFFLRRPFFFSSSQPIRKWVLLGTCSSHKFISYSQARSPQGVDAPLKSCVRDGIPSDEAGKNLPDDRSFVASRVRAQRKFPSCLLRLRRGYCLLLREYYWLATLARIGFTNCKRGFGGHLRWLEPTSFIGLWTMAAIMRI